MWLQDCVFTRSSASILDRHVYSLCRTTFEHANQLIRNMATHSALRQKPLSRPAEKGAIPHHAHFCRLVHQAEWLVLRPSFALAVQHSGHLPKKSPDKPPAKKARVRGFMASYHELKCPDYTLRREPLAVRACPTPPSNAKKDFAPTLKAAACIANVPYSNVCELCLQPVPFLSHFALGRLCRCALSSKTIDLKRHLRANCDISPRSALLQT